MPAGPSLPSAGDRHCHLTTLKGPCHDCAWRANPPASHASSPALKCWKHWREIEWPALHTPSRDRKIYRLSARAMPTGPRLEFLIDGLRPDTGFGTRVIAPFHELTHEEIRGMPREAYLWMAALEPVEKLTR